jgi:hypothetical protein
MSRPTHYSPPLSRFIVSALYHEAKHRRMPMTRLADQLLHQALMGTTGWRIAVDSSSTPPPAAEKPVA